MHKILSTLLLILFVLPHAVQAAKLYKWVDEDGNVSYHQHPPRDKGKYNVEEKDFSRQLESSRKSGDIKNRLRLYPVTLYMVPKCATCDLVRQYLKSRKVPYSEMNVENNKAAQAELTRISGKLEVPVVTVGKGLVRGYTLETLNKELANAGYIKSEETTQADTESTNQ